MNIPVLARNSFPNQFGLLKISVVTCSYNHVEFIEDTIRSVITQDYPNFEYIIIDGGSTDGSAALIARYESYLAFWVSERDSGQAEALHKGFEKATGDILCWLCSDDLLEPGTLSEVAEMFLRRPAVDVFYGDTLFIDRAGKVFRRYKTLPFNKWIWLNTANYIPQPSTFWRRSIYERVGGLDKYLVFMDSDLFWRFSKFSRLQHVKRVWSRMRLYPEAISRSRRIEGDLAHAKRAELCYGPRSALNKKITRSLAKIARVTWKLAEGCYW